MNSIRRFLLPIAAWSVFSSVFVWIVIWLASSGDGLIVLPPWKLFAILVACKMLLTSFLVKVNE